jgi:hypothetical protein
MSKCAVENPRYRTASAGDELDRKLREEAVGAKQHGARSVMHCAWMPERVTLQTLDAVAKAREIRRIVSGGGQRNADEWPASRRCLRPYCWSYEDRAGMAGSRPLPFTSRPSKRGCQQASGVTLAKVRRGNNPSGNDFAHYVGLASGLKLFEGGFESVTHRRNRFRIERSRSYK